MTANEFHAELQKTAPGGAFVYHTGNLALERDNPPLGPVIDGLGFAAWREYLAGRVFLTQRRVELGRCAYIATKARGG